MDLYLCECSLLRTKEIWQLSSVLVDKSKGGVYILVGSVGNKNP